MVAEVVVAAEGPMGVEGLPAAVNWTIVAGFSPKSNAMKSVAIARKKTNRPRALFVWSFISKIIGVESIYLFWGWARFPFFAEKL